MIKFKFLGANGSCQDEASGNTSVLFYDGFGAFCVDLSCNMAAVVDARVDAVVLTHEHIDHVYALPSLLHQLWLTGRESPLDIFIPNGLEHIANGLIDLFNIRSKKGIFPITIRTDGEFTVGKMHVTTFRTDHTATSMGITLEDGDGKLVYTCDSRPIHNIPEVMHGAHVLIHETSGLRENEETLVKKGHSSGADAAELAQALNVQTLYLCHLPRGEGAKTAILAEARESFAQSVIPEILREYMV